MARTVRHHDTNVTEAARLLEKAAYSYSIDRLFSDAIEMMFLALSKRMSRTMEEAEQREARYMRIVKEYTRGKTDEENPQGYEIIRNVFPQLMAMTTLDMDRRPRDFLGMVAGALETLSPHLGQFFTPQAVSDMMAMIEISPEMVRKSISTRGYFSVMEPACGGGGMLLSVAHRMRELGFDPGKNMLAYAIDISPKSYHMCYVQLQLAGVPAHVYLGDGLDPEIEKNHRDKATTSPYVQTFVPAIKEFQTPKFRSRSRPRTTAECSSPPKIAAE